ncbi:MAG: hypothetical protein HYV27_08160 [Candidatus Hydrogenedentes bacterium]|nr:hypothetical protein [Candidatus Hydrogenedentota bacterium]
MQPKQPATAAREPLFPPSNHFDLAWAQEWMEGLDLWIDTHGLSGYDPFDIKQHPWIRAAQPHAFLRKSTTALCDTFPEASRRWLGVAPTENPKAYALTALGKFRLFELTGRASLRDQAVHCLDWLLRHGASGHSGLCWGYPFHIAAKGLNSQAHTPVLVIGSIAGEALLEAHRLTGEARFLDAAVSIGEFILKDLPRIPGENGTHCFAYTPTDRRRVHNANLLGAEHLYRLHRATGSAHYIEAAAPAVAYSLAHQREDGAWSYGEFAEGDPFEAGLLALVDHHHTGFVLRSLHTIHAITGRDDAIQALQRGFNYYRTLIQPDGMPVNAYAKYPVDIHACAEGVLCPNVLQDVVLPARKYKSHVLRWSYWHMRNHEDNTVYYRKYPFFTSKLVFPRWGMAWMYRAVAEYLYQNR